MPRWARLDQVGRRLRGADPTLRACRVADPARQAEPLQVLLVAPKVGGGGVQETSGPGRPLILFSRRSDSACGCSWLLSLRKQAVVPALRAQLVAAPARRAESLDGRVCRVAGPARPVGVSLRTAGCCSFVVAGGVAGRPGRAGR